MNTVECVVKGHTAFTSNIFSANTVNHYMMMNICWCAWVVSFVLAIVGALMFHAWMKLDNQEHQKKSALILLLIVFILEVIIAIVACTNSSQVAVYPIFFIISMGFLSGIVLLYMRCRNNKLCQILLAALAFSTLFMSFHHLIWIVFGVLTEPFWAVPVLVVACSFCFSVFVQAYYNFKAFERCDVQAFFLSVAVIISLLLFFFVTGVVSQSFLSSSPVSGLIQSALVVIATLWMSYVKRFA